MIEINLPNKERLILVEEKIRTLGFYQPFGSLMLHGKIETRFVHADKKPPFPKGKYLLYTTKKKCSNAELFQWCGADIMYRISEVLKDESTASLHGYAIATGELEEPYWMRGQDEQQAFVKAVYDKVITNHNGAHHRYRQWCLPFKNVQRIEPFEWKFGKQGVGFVPESEIDKIKIPSSNPTCPTMSM